MRRFALTIAVLCVMTIALACSSTDRTLILATTTSTADSGLLDEILPVFEKEANATVKVLAVGTGQALALGERGDADVVLVHDTVREEKFVSDGFGEARVELMYNDFVVLGPADDPVGIAGVQSVVEAFAMIAEKAAASGASFLSRGDQSGTHSKELRIWEETGLTPSGDWYRSTGQGMGNTLTVANELQAYTFSDRGTFLARKDNFDLKVLVEGDLLLLNQYGVIAVTSPNHPSSGSELARQLIQFLTRVDTQERIAEFGIDRFGQTLFQPNSAEWRAKQTADQGKR